MSQNEYDAAVAEFMRTKGITRCPTACAVPTHADVAENDRAALSEITTPPRKPPASRSREASCSSPPDFRESPSLNARRYRPW